MAEAQWYIVHTYSGYENKVKSNLEKTIANRHLEDRILEVRIPLEDVEQYKNGQWKIVQRKLFPGYVFIKMVYDNDIWYIVRNTRGVTGFVGADGEATPIDESEMERSEAPLDIVIDFEVGDKIKVDLEDQEIEGTILSIDMKNRTVQMVYERFGQDFSMEVGFAGFTKIAQDN